MTPAELITRKLRDAIEAAGASVPVYSLLLEAMSGERHETPSSGIAINVHITGQLAEPLPLYTFGVSAILTCSIDDDKGGVLFKRNYNAIWAVFDRLARGDNCAEICGDGFAADGFQLSEGDPPDFQEDENGGSWTVTFAATITGRA